MLRSAIGLVPGLLAALSAGTVKWIKKIRTFGGARLRATGRSTSSETSGPLTSGRDTSAESVDYGARQMARIILALLLLVISTFAGKAQETGRPASGPSNVSPAVTEPEPNVAEASRRIAKAKAEGSNDLDLGALSLRDIPEEVYELTNLKRLYLGLALVARQSALVGEEDKRIRNRIATVPAKLFAALARLDTLDLSYNDLSTLPSEIGAHGHLSRLWLTGNRFGALPSGVEKLGTLEDLKFASNQLTSLPPGIVGLSSLRQLDVADNRLSALPPEVG